MGGVNPPAEQILGGGGGSTGSSLSDLVLAMENLQAEIESLFEDGGSRVNTDIFTFATHLKAYALYTTPKKVRKAILQNITNTDIITVVAVSNGNGVAQNITKYQGVLLNPAGTANQGGGSVPFGNIDLSNLTVMCDTTDALVGLSVTYEY